MEKRTLSVQEAAVMCGVSISTIYDMVRNGEIPHIRLRNRILFHYDVIDKWLRGELREIT